MSDPQMQEGYSNWATSNMKPANHYGQNAGPNRPHSAYQYAIGHEPKIARRIAGRFYGIDPDVWSCQACWSTL